jgi:hypothetical protein
MKPLQVSRLTAAITQPTKFTWAAQPCLAAEAQIPIHLERLLRHIPPAAVSGSGKKVLNSDPQTDVVPVVKLAPQCAFEELVIGCPAIHTDFRSLLRSSSTCEPSDPPLAVVLHLDFLAKIIGCKLRLAF